LIQRCRVVGSLAEVNAMFWKVTPAATPLGPVSSDQTASGPMHSEL
jgi:hypothetical protein